MLEKSLTLSLTGLTQPFDKLPEVGVYIDIAFPKPEFFSDTAAYGVMSGEAEILPYLVSPQS